MPRSAKCLKMSNSEPGLSSMLWVLGRIHLSGRIDLMSPEQRDRVRQAVRTYQGYRGVLATAQPYWPLGLPGWYDERIALALLGADEGLLAVWWRGAQPPALNMTGMDLIIPFWPLSSRSLV